MMQKEGKTGYIEQYSTQEKGEKKRKTHVDRRPLGHSTLLISASGDRSSVRHGTGTLYTHTLPVTTVWFDSERYLRVLYLSMVGWPLRIGSKIPLCILTAVVVVVAWTERFLFSSSLFTNQKNMGSFLSQYAKEVGIGAVTALVGVQLFSPANPIGSTLRLFKQFRSQVSW